MLIADIIIGERVRKDVGDIQGLAASIEKHGLLHPVVVKSDGTLVAGFRRLEAYRMMARTDIPVTVVDVTDMLSAERDENAERKDFTPTEAVAIGELIAHEHQKKIAASVSAQRSYAGKITHGTSSGTEKPAVHGRTAEVVAKALGMGMTPYRQAAQVVAAAKIDPGTFGDLPAQMDETGNIAGTHAEMVHRKKNTKKRHAVHNKMHHRKPNEEIKKAIVMLGGVVEVLNDIDRNDIDVANRAEWGQAIRSAGYSLETIGRKMINGKR